jgi:hypothetical protein
MLDRQETIRSKTAEGVYQEAWGLLTAYNLIRVEMEQAVKIKMSNYRRKRPTTTDAPASGALK